MSSGIIPPARRLCAAKHRCDAQSHLVPSACSTRRPWPWGGALLAAALLHAPVLWAQTPTPTAASASSDESIVLSPFVVSSERDTGYAATDSLAGTRLRTPLKDIAASVSVVTKDLLDDLAATNLDNLLVYTTGTEVAGVAGNFSNMTTGQYAMEGETVREAITTGPTARDSGGNNRVRGLAAADLTRNFFSSPYIPMDAYNTQSVTINRGANAILFGFGSPAGIIENSLSTPSFKNRGTAQARFGSYGSYRASLDIDRVLLKGKLAVRLIGMNERRYYEQEFTFRDQRRTYGAATFRPFRSTTIRINGESGQVEQRLPRTDPPVDSLTTWWDFGKPAKVTTANNDAAYKDWMARNNVSGMAAQWEANTGLIYPGPNAYTPVDGFPSWSTSTIAQYYSAPKSSREVAQSIYLNPLAPFMMSRQILDRSIFDYRTQLIDGPNSSTKSQFNTANAAIEQLFLDGNAGIELVYDYQEAEQSTLRKFMWWRANNIFIDPQLVTPDGRTNPNFGRPFIASKGTFNYDHAKYETARATAFLKHDFSKRPGFLGRLLGTQTVTGLYTDHKNEAKLMSGDAAMAAMGWRGGNGGTGWADRTITTVVYLGPSLANAASAKGAHISGVQVETQYPDEFSPWTVGREASNNKKWVQVPTKIYQYPDYAHLARDSRVTANNAETYAGVWQANWWDSTLVSTAGWRHDKMEGFEGSWPATQNPVTGAVNTSRAPVNPKGAAEKSTFSYGLALHVPARYLRSLPGRPNVSFYYNDSANFQVTGYRMNILGDPLGPQEGTTKEYAVRLSALDEKFSVRVTHYETKQDNINDRRVAGLVNKVAYIEDFIYTWVPQATLNAAGYVGPLDTRLPALSDRYFKAWGWVYGGLTADGTTYTNPTYTAPSTTTTAITSMVSKGLEIEGVYNPTRNWRIMFNAAKQEAVQGATDATVSALVAERMKEWTKPAIWSAPLNNNVWTGQTLVEAQIINPLNTAILSTGGPVAELRKWRANLMTNYKFSYARLKGWSIGGAARWQDKVMIGYPVIQDPKLGLVTDVNHPFMGPDEIAFDAWLGYERRIFRNRVGWKIQLNVRNLLDNNLLIPVRANPVVIGDLNTHENVAYRIGERRTWQVMSTFSF
ncbi:TonB-dependent receptor plug domain-containing protein [Opitutus sp. ER46]|uniref:TonB-dependent receptor plug domain-containing protein n=1 Tax=Opitutus sp. ER46 TaxID=2161864 RepID=UPI000D3234F4|nr:TonB-dependent receptor plug domain-containing protein [Opitutus sp. ER46]PTX96546.1 hypothetical protein DB354_07770 [Opitutus sp. ER46]